MNILRNFLFIGLILLSGAGCATMGAKNQADLLSTQVNQYAADFRWGRYRDAYKYHVDQEGRQPAADLAQLENFSITDFRILGLSLNETATIAEVPVEIEYVNNQYGSVSKINQKQLWWFSQEKQTWFVESAFPVLE